MKKWIIKLNDFFRWWEFNKKFLRWADPWRYKTTVYEQNRRDLMAEILSDKRYDSILEAGCYEGLFSERLLPLGKHLVLLDISPVALKRCRRNMESIRRSSRSSVGSAEPSIEYVRANLRTWNPGGQRFDLIVLGDVFYYLDPAIKLEKWFGKIIHSTLQGAAHRVCAWLRPQGRVLLAQTFGDEKQLAHRREIRDMFLFEGLKVLQEKTGPTSDKGGSRVFLDLLEKPRG